MSVASTLAFISMGLILAGCSSLQTLFFDGKPPQEPFSRDHTATFLYQQDFRGAISESDFFRFIENLKYVYLDLARGEHKTFQPDSEAIGNGTSITNSEQTGKQFVIHRYRVEVDKNIHSVRWVSNPSVVEMLPWGFKLEIATVLTMKFDDGTLRTQLDLVFGSKRDLDQSLRSDLKELWGAHNEREMSNACRILLYLKTSGQLYNNPSTWRINDIQDSLL